MNSYIEMVIVLPLLVLCYQLYSFSVNSSGTRQQERSQKLGILFMTAGVMALVPRSAILSYFGLILMMFGFRLLAKSLDRLDKRRFIDRYEDD
ncbi:MAG: hypothetical protein PHY09_00080 [Desulfuromonadaceae bacterium]|nr:hypothetical protein [Desulfuromonadaceae bacterium]MDD5105952.1 hypothetical protein [Desulfuromonadaceae bacterium]